MGKTLRQFTISRYGTIPLVTLFFRQPLGCASCTRVWETLVINLDACGADLGLAMTKAVPDFLMTHDCIVNGIFPVTDWKPSSCECVILCTV